MNRILLHANNPDYMSIIKHTSVIYDHDREWHCIYVDSETLCFLKLKYNIDPWGYKDYIGMPTFLLNIFQ